LDVDLHQQFFRELPGLQLQTGAASLVHLLWGTLDWATTSFPSSAAYRQPLWDYDSTLDHKSQSNKTLLIAYISYWFWSSGQPWLIQLCKTQTRIIWQYIPSMYKNLCK
jgi:hypothetical protein